MMGENNSTLIDLHNIGQRMSDYLRQLAKTSDDDIAFLLSQEWDLKIQEIQNVSTEN